MHASFIASNNHALTARSLAGMDSEACHAVVHRSSQVRSGVDSRRLPHYVHVLERRPALPGRTDLRKRYHAQLMV
jgi:hypothetical protein